MLLNALELSFTREVELIASTHQPASTVHTFSFTLPAPSIPLAPSSMASYFFRLILRTLRSSYTKCYFPLPILWLFPHTCLSSPFLGL
ncbi:hypothetical protein BGY98DRAFT_1005221 [Russula aff. rugulosa BPL654]|nr:hypothetical protein BGY98DRAFT_1005221 [Russula aff. rugulosa BPL654]